LHDDQILRRCPLVWNATLFRETRHPFSIEPEDWERTDIPPFPGVEDERKEWSFLIRDFGVQILLRPGFCSQVGFLGRGEQLDDLIAMDDATLGQLGAAHEQVADELERIVLDSQHSSRPN
jgi:hypothetical protein